MKAMVLEAPNTPLELREVPIPEPRAGEVLVKVGACGVCRTDLHIVDGDITEARPPIIPGHEIVGRIECLGSRVSQFSIGERVGIPWLGHTCGACRYCLSSRENLCDAPAFTGYQIDGGYGEYARAEAGFCFPVHGDYSDGEAAPLLCAGLIGHRSLKLAGEAETLGIYGFGVAAHIVAQVALHQGRKVFAFTRAGDQAAQQFALSLGCAWAGASGEAPPEPLDAAIIFAPVGALVPVALRAVRKGGTVILGGIQMSEIPPMPYEILWGERVVRSVANLTREDGREFLELAPRVPVHTSVTEMALEETNKALDMLRAGQATGALVLVP